MSLYHEAAQILSATIDHGGSIKSIVFGRKEWKTDKKMLFALSTETAKWSEILSEVVERSDVLRDEKQLTPVLALVLTHDLLLSRRGVALPAKHGLHTTISRHKGRLTSELTKARLKRGCPSLEKLREHVNAGTSGHEASGSDYVHPRWVRINTLLSTLGKELATTFADYTKVDKLSAITTPRHSGKRLVYVDPNIPDLVAIPGSQDLSGISAYKEGRLIFQEKASCFPAYLLDPSSHTGDIIDACSAPGNKTTHLAALAVAASRSRPSIFACEKDAARSETLAKMIKLAGAGDLVKVKPKQDFLKLDPRASEFEHVECLLLDPSCSGSGIVGRDEVSVTIHLPSRAGAQQPETTRGKKRKRGAIGQQSTPVKSSTPPEIEATAEEIAPSTNDEGDGTKLSARLANLSSFQLHLLKHAMLFPSARKITYSTCSLHKEENEHVVTRAVLSDVAQDRGWRVVRRHEQVPGMRSWNLRGHSEVVVEIAGDGGGGVDSREVADACIRCEKGGEGGTMGFFVAGFVREIPEDGTNGRVANAQSSPQMKGGGKSCSDEKSEGEDDDDEWNGFSDSDG